MRELLLLFLVRGPTCRGSFSPAEAFPLPKPRTLKNPIIPATATRRSSRRRPSVIFFLSAAFCRPRHRRAVPNGHRDVRIRENLPPRHFLAGLTRCAVGRWLTIADAESFFNTLTTGRGIHGIFSLGDFLRVVGHGLRFGVW